MKKVFTILLGMFLVISMVGCVCAVDITPESNSKVGTTTVSYNVAETYTVTIPDSIVLGSDTGQEYGTIYATITKIAPDHLLNITITGDSYDGTNDIWYLTHNDGEDKLGYYIEKGGHVSSTTGGSPVDYGNVVLSVPATQKLKQEIQIHCRLVTDVATITHSGTYSDQLKFTVSIEEDPSPSPSNE